MRHCTHNRHRTTTVAYETPSRTGQQTIVLGMNPIHRREEMCDQGFVKEEVRPKVRQAKYVKEETNYAEV